MDYPINLALAIDISSCTTISSRGNYTLTGNLLNTVPSTCINIKSSDVIINFYEGKKESPMDDIIKENKKTIPSCLKWYQKAFIGAVSYIVYVISFVILSPYIIFMKAKEDYKKWV